MGWGMADTPKFIVDHNVGKLTGWLRLMGYDTRFFDGEDDSELVAAAKAEGRVILSRDTRIMQRRLITSGQVKAVLIVSDQPERQIRQVIGTLGLDSQFKPFSLCLECNQPLVERAKDEVKDLVPPYVFKTQNQFMQCPNCQRIYWRGTHWQAMTERLEKF
jgi:uncharacterized protein with PIN domain